MMDSGLATTIHSMKRKGPTKESFKQHNPLDKECLPLQDYEVKEFRYAGSPPVTQCLPLPRPEMWGKQLPIHAKEEEESRQHSGILSATR